MCGTDFCVGCLPSAQIVAWMEGRVHELPAFGDSNQERVAAAARNQLLWRKLDACELEVARWPEYRSHPESMRHVAKLGAALRKIARSELPTAAREIVLAQDEILREEMERDRFVVDHAIMHHHHFDWVMEHDRAEAIEMFFKIPVHHMGRLVYERLRPLQDQLRRWVESNLATAEMLVIGQLVFADGPVANELKAAA